MRRSPHPLNPWVIALCVVFLVGIASVIAWSTGLERPYPCGGRHNCSPEVVR